MTRRRIVVTGLGLVTPVGNTVAESWANIVAGQSGIDLVTRFDASNLSVRFAGEVKGFRIEDYIPAKEARHMDVFIHYGIAASLQAVADAGLPTGDALDEALAERIGVMVGPGSACSNPWCPSLRWASRPCDRSNAIVERRTARCGARRARRTRRASARSSAGRRCRSRPSRRCVRPAPR